MRTKNSIINLITALLGQFFGLAISFVARIVFIRLLGADYLGINSLFTNILTMLSLVELGVGAAMSYTLYAPLAEHNHAKIKSLMHFYRTAYRVIGAAILAIGILLTPVYPLFLNFTPDIPNLNLIYVLFVINTGISYFYSYKRTLIICDQKKYITTIYRYGCYFVLNIAQIVALLLTHNYLLFLIIQILFTLVENILVSQKADRLYPYLKSRDTMKLTRAELKPIKKNIRAMSLHKIGSIAVNSTDNILLSKIVGLVSVAKYSNYYLIISAIETITNQFFNATLASVGHLNASESKQKVESTFNTIFLLNYLIFSNCAILFFCLANNIVEKWVGADMVFESGIILTLTICLYLKGMRRSVLMFRDAMGLFWHDRYKAIVETVINLVASIILGMQMGTIGIFIGTIISTVMTSLWVEPYVLYKYGFNSKLRKYFFSFLKYTVYTIFSGVICYCISLNFLNNLILRTIAVFILSVTLTTIPVISSPDAFKLREIVKDIFQKITRQIGRIQHPTLTKPPK